MTINVNSDILIWARKTAGFSVKDAATKLHLTTSSNNTAVDKLKALESGEKFPTQNQLNSMANVYKRPLLTFYMAEPPRPGPRGTDFRLSPNTYDIRDNALLDAFLRDIRARQEMVRDMLIDEEDFKPLDFVGSITMEQTVNHAVNTISHILEFDHLSPHRGNPDKLFKQLRNAAETVGIFVLVLSDLGSHHSTIPANVFRGFAIADTITPFAVINAKDARPARAFTLIHELTHIFLGQTGISGSLFIDKPKTYNARVERFCNDVAGEFLLPTKQLLKDISTIDINNIGVFHDAIETIADRWSVSEPMVAYRLHRLNIIGTTTYNILKSKYDARWQKKLKRDHKHKRQGPNPRVMKQFYLGNALLRVVHQYVRNNSLSHTKAATLLGSKPCAVEPLLRLFETKQTSFVSKKT